MGERAPVIEAAPARRRDRGLVGLAVLLALLVAVAFVNWPRDEDEITAALLAASLLEDGDAVVGAADRARLLSWQARPAGSGGEAPAPRTVASAAGPRLDAPAWYGWFLAPWVGLAGPRGGAVAQALLFAVVALLLRRVLAARLGAGASAFVAWGLFGSVLFAYAVRLWPETLVALLVGGGSALALWRPGPPPERLPDVWHDPAAEPAPRRAARWAAAGLLLGAAAGAGAIWAPLALAAPFAVPRALRRSSLPAYLAAGIAAFAGVFVLGGGPGAWLGAASATSGGVIETGPGALDLAAGSGATALLDPRTWAWNLVFALVGRHAGALLYLAPALVAVVGLRRGDGRGAVAAASLASLLLALGLTPWSWSGGALPLGPRALVPLAPALLLVLGRPLARSALVIGWVWSAAFLGLFWLAPGRPLVDGEGRAVFPLTPLANWLPLETTQTAVPSGPDLDFGAVELRFLAGPAWPGPGPGRFQVLGGREVEILVAARRPVAALDLTLPEEAGFEVELQGAEMGETTFRPDGRVAFTVRLDEPRVRHPTATAPTGMAFRTFRFRLPTAPLRPLTVAVAVREAAVE